jgi:hypothetical protein
MSFDILLSNETIGFFVAFSLLIKANNFFTNYGIPEISQTFHPFYRPKERAKILDDFDHCVINRTIHGLYSWKIALTVSIIHKKIKDSNNFFTNYGIPEISQTFHPFYKKCKI